MIIIKYNFEKKNDVFGLEKGLISMPDGGLILVYHCMFS